MVDPKVAMIENPAMSSAPSPSPAGFRQVDHTADLAVRLWAPDEPALLEVAAVAVTALLTDGEPVVGDDAREVELDGLDAEDRLVQWMNEIIFLATVDDFVVGRAEVDLHGAGGLSARLFGRENARDRLVADVKAATYHDLRLLRGPEGIRTMVVLDV